MDGPVVFDAEDGHAVVSTHVFPRKVAQLRFRILRKGQPSQFFSIQNPAYKAEVPILKASSRPCEVKMEDGIYRLSDFGIETGSAGQSFRPSLSFDHDLRFNVLKTRTAVYDSQGNYYPAGRLRDRIWPLTGEHLFRVVMRVERSKEQYPWKLGHATLIADGRAGATVGALPTAEINADGKKMGFETIRFQAPPKGEKSLHRELPWNFSFMLEGKGRTREDIEGIILCIFPKTGGRQNEIHGPLCGTSSLNLPLGFKKVQNFDLKCGWLGDLAPGEEFSVGIITEPFEEAEFVIDLDAAMKFDFR